MKISIHDIKIPYNLVLILPDKEFTSFHLNGKESLPAGKVDLENVAEHYSVRGQVFGVPEELVFSLDRIQAIHVPDTFGMRQEETVFYLKSQMTEAKNYKDGSVAYDVGMDVRVGDIAYFNYQEHYNCYEEGRYVDTIEHGEMLLIKYDQLICAETEYEGLVMLNGILLIEPISLESTFGKNIFSKAGFDIVNLKSKEDDIKKKLNIGFVRAWGRPVRKYMDFPENKDGNYNFQDGQIVMYNPKVAPPLEYQLHNTMFEGKTLLKLRRRYIFAILPMDIASEEVTDLVTNINLN